MDTTSKSVSNTKIVLKKTIKIMATLAAALNLPSPAKLNDDVSICGRVSSRNWRRGFAGMILFSSSRLYVDYSHSSHSQYTYHTMQPQERINSPLPLPAVFYEVYPLVLNTLLGSLLVLRGVWSVRMCDFVISGMYITAAPVHLHTTRCTTLRNYKGRFDIPGILCFVNDTALAVPINS